MDCRLYSGTIEIKINDRYSELILPGDFQLDRTGVMDRATNVVGTSDPVLLQLSLVRR